MTSPALIGIAAGAAQALAYGVYIHGMLRGETRPNAMTWVMWAGGSFAFAVIAGGAGAPAGLLVAPLVAALGSGAVAGIAFARRLHVGPDLQDWLMLCFGAAIGLWGLLIFYGSIEGLGFGEGMGVVFAALTAVGALAAAWPILRTTCFEPANEQPLAWFVWSGAYGLMALAVMRDGTNWHYLAYPVIAQAVHLLIGVFAFGKDDSPQQSRGEPVA